MEIRRFFVWSLIFLISGLGTCSLCPESDNESLLQINTLYTYRYRSEALAQAVGTTQNQGKLTLECDVHVAHERACLYHLDLHNCMLTATGGEPGSTTAWIPQQHLPELSKYPVAFTLSNGEITEVKTHDEDPLYYVNIKRGVLSAFVFKLSQAKMEMHESHTDIHGTCPLTSVPIDDGEGTVKTSKDMLLCNFPSRPDWQLSPWSLFWNMSFIQHVINSTTDCEYKIHENLRRVNKVFCKERHAIMLESTHRTTTAVQTNVFYYLDFVKAESQTSKPAFPILTRKTGIQFEYEETPVPQSSPPNFLPAAKKMLSDLVLDSVDEVRLFTIPQFVNFVGWIRSSDNLRPLVDSVSDCSFLTEGAQCDQRITDLAYSYLSDALLQCNSIPCAKTLTYLIMNDRISPAYLNVIFHSWSYMHYSKPGFIMNFADICRLKNSNQCWMSLGSFVRRIQTRNIDVDEKILQEIKEVSSYFYNRITEECEVNEDANKDYTNCLMILKATSNIGNYYSKITSDGINQLLELTTEEELPTVVRTSALEALKDIFDADNQEQKQLIYDRLLPLMMNTTLPASIRILSYNQLLHVSHGYNFQEHLLQILKQDSNTEVKYFIAQSINSLMTNSEFKSRRFLHSLMELLQENDISLERILHDLKGKSKSSSYSMFLNLPFMPNYMKQFGVKLRDSLVYDSHVYPTIFSQESIFQLFSSFLPESKFASYAEGWEELILSFKKNLGDMNSHPVSFSKIFEALMKSLKEYGKLDEESLRNFDDHVLANLKELHKLYWDHHKKLIPYAKAYLDLFGSTVKYFIEDSFKSGGGNQGIERLLHNIVHKLAEGVNFNTTRVVRVIEAYHQVPTMMGLPLNWTTNATLAFSLRTGFRLQMNREKNHFHSKGFFQPSAALTFLNRMVVDFPTFTQIGVQANSSGYTSTEFKGQFSSVDGKQTFRFDRPSRTQKVLELFRTNQMIKHNSYEDIPDWDIERTFSSWCTRDPSAMGLKFCLAKSYPNVTHRIKPWALMAGWCKWQLLAHPTSRSDVHYDLELHQASKQNVKEITAKFIISDDNKERSSNFKAALEENGKDVKLELRTSIMPDFVVSLSKSELANKKAFGHKIQAILKLAKDFKYELEYIDEGKIQRTSTQANMPFDEDNQKLINEEHLNIKTPFSVYKWNKSVFKMGENTKAEAFLSYEKFKGNSNWMRSILPSEFWESDNKAFLKVLLHWKKPIYSSQETVTRQTEFRIQIPRYVMTLTGYSLVYTGREQIIVNLAKMDVNRGKIDAFMNFTYDYWANENNRQYKRIRLFNVTIPQRSWSAMFEDANEGYKYTHALVLKRAAMKPINDLKTQYVGWWSDEVSDRFKLEEEEVKLISTLEAQMWSSADIAEKFPSVSNEDLKGLASTAYGSKVVLYYPLNDRTEKVDFDGYFISSMGGPTYRFQKTFDMLSTYNNLKLTSHSVLRLDKGTSTLYHNSYFTHLPTDTKAYNTIHFVWKSLEGQCTEIEFNHDIRSHVFDLSTDATYKCESGIDGLHTLRLAINTNSSKWNMLDMKLDQVVEDVSPDYTREEMTTTHALGTIHVDAEWTSLPYHHQKHVTLCSKNGNCPNAELFLEAWDRDWNLKFSRPDYDVTYRHRLSADYKTLRVEMGYGNKEEGESSVMDFTGEILDQNYHVWKGTLNRNAFNKVKEIFVSGYKKFSHAIEEVASDKNHPLNDMLQPALKMTLYDYWKSLKAQYKEFFGFSWSEIKEVIYTLDAFMEPAYKVIMNSAATFKNLCSSAYEKLKTKTVTVWALDYFHVPYYIGQGIMGLPRGLKELWNQIVFGEENILHFRFFTGKLFSMTSFRYGPCIEFELGNLKRLVPFKSVYERKEKDKVGMIFGPLHVYTFDGHLYDIPEYPHADCSYLLAHDVHKSLFTAFSSRKAIHLLFPEMSVSINDQNEVFVNGSMVPTSLPIQSNNGKVTVRRGHVVEVWSPSLTVICRSHDFLCMLKLSDYHAGGIIGLLGNADENPHNDFMLISGNTSSSLVEFVSKYEISGKPECQKLEMPTSSASETSDEVPEACLEAFGKSCKKRPDVREKFLKSCTDDVRAGHGACYAAAGLSALCNHKYSPSHTKCNVNKQESEEIGRKLEVVFVVQETKYLTSTDKSNAPIKGIESLITAINSKFSEDGYGSIKYSVVGFGGNGVHYLPSVHSSQKSLWVDAGELIDNVLKTLAFKSREEADGVEVLKYALEELGHDSFNSKVFIVITAKDKQVADKSLMNYVHTLLEENGVTVYTLSSYPSIEKGKKVFGVRADGLIFPSQTEDGDAYLDYPRGSLAKLTSSTRGSVFLTKFLRDNQPTSFFTEIAQEIWAKVSKESKKCRSCEPVRGGWWWYKNKCRIVHC